MDPAKRRLKAVADGFAAVRRMQEEFQRNNPSYPVEPAPAPVQPLTRTERFLNDAYVASFAA